ncbi:MAG: TIM barrel protein [Planctomycetia bacterium]|nr:TIM barrel protein [Planctomycetia bacterium]
MNRRDFLHTAAAATVVGAASFTLPTQVCAETPQWKTKLLKALICGEPSEQVLTNWKALGFHGAETTAWSVGFEKAEKARIMADRVGMQIHSVMRAWTNFNNPNSLQGDIDSVVTALESAKGYGANAILLVPCRTGGTMPQPHEFRIEFDPDTLMVSKVADGDNSRYAAYIEAQNYATKVSIEALKGLIPAAEKNGVVIGIENVWNNLWITPDFFAAFVKYFRSPWIQGYFDIGNHVKYAKPEEYIYALGKDIIKMHVKDFRLNEKQPGTGNFCEIRAGSVNWPVVRKAIEDVGYNGFMTIEGGGDPNDKKSADLDLIIAGK